MAGTEDHMRDFRRSYFTIRYQYRVDGGPWRSQPQLLTSRVHDARSQVERYLGRWPEFQGYHVEVEVLSVTPWDRYPA